jgi:hypothetical protein
VVIPGPLTPTGTAPQSGPLGNVLCEIIKKRSKRTCSKQIRGRAVELRDYLYVVIALQCGMADNRAISQLEAEGYPWIGCECCKGTVWVPFRMLRERIPMLSAMTLDQLGAKMKCNKCGKRPERYYPANQSDTPGFVRRI